MLARAPNQSAANRVYATPEAMFEAMFGPEQHDAHCRAHHQHMWLVRQNAGLKAGEIAIAAAIAEMIAQARAEREARR